MSSLQVLVDAADEAALLRAVDGLCAVRDWDALVDLARRCRDAVEIGKQLWPVATHIDYRLALEAPASYAGGVLHTGAGRFALGPLTEVAGARHPWVDIAPHIPDPAAAGAVAQERVIRGEDLRGRAGAAVPADLPLVLAAFEPEFSLPVYRDREARFPAPGAATQRLPPPAPLAPGRPLDDDATSALVDVVATWASESSGRVAAVACEGGPPQAIGLLAPVAAVGELSIRDALGILQWAGASGAARGRRRGGAAGRFAAWWAAAALAGLHWPEEPATDEDFVDELADALDELRWYRWSRPAAERGWVLRLAVHDPVDGLSWAIEATDELEEDSASDPSTPEAASGGTR